MKQKNGLLLVSLISLINITIAIPHSTILREIIKPGDLVFDIGSHMGKKADLYLELGAQVVCVEPQPICEKFLQEKYNKNNNVVVVNKGITDIPCQLPMLICPTSNAISTFSKEWTNEGRFFDAGYVWNQTIIVEMTTLDELIKSYGLPQFCKIDVENFEYNVLKGLSQPIPYVSFEFAIEFFKNTEKCLERLVELGYNSFNFALGEKTELFLKKWTSKEELLSILKLNSVNIDKMWGDIYAKYQ